MKFDFAIGNPPYQETAENTSDRPVYNEFMDGAFKIADIVELITPARFLFKAGKTPISWNEKMLNDSYFKVLKYEQDSSKIFANTDIKGGVAITYRNANKKHIPIGIFTAFNELNSIIGKVMVKTEDYIDKYVYSPESYRFTEEFHKAFPNVRKLLSNGHDNDLTTNIFEKIPFVFSDIRTDTSNVGIFGRLNNQRIYKYINKDYIKGPENFEYYKIILPKSNGSGAIGEVLSTPIIGQPIIGQPIIGHTQTFMSIGCLLTETECNNCYKYICSKFLRCMLGVLKVTQDNKKSVWRYVPLQDFTFTSDIDWSVSISNIDKQLYKKYNLSQEEIDFIETNVKEMN